MLYSTYAVRPANAFVLNIAQGSSPKRAAFGVCIYIYIGTVYVTRCSPNGKTKAINNRACVCVCVQKDPEKGSGVVCVCVCSFSVPKVPGKSF